MTAANLNGWSESPEQARARWEAKQTEVMKLAEATKQASPELVELLNLQVKTLEVLTPAPAPASKAGELEAAAAQIRQDAKRGAWVIVALYVLAAVIVALAQVMR